MQNESQNPKKNTQPSEPDAGPHCGQTADPDPIKEFIYEQAEEVPLLGKHPERTLVQIAEQSSRIRMTLAALSASELFEFLQCEHARSLHRQIRKEAQL
jgi:hypothetical protein